MQIATPVHVPELILTVHIEGSGEEPYMSSETFKSLELQIFIGEDDISKMGWYVGDVFSIDKIHPFLSKGILTGVQTIFLA